ncbi:MarR family winged helix-turn-helix transcriptional regulator [Streptomyces glaucescens]|uniref:MarR family winged helix-turn-helix transcriptional regulator n=1 Tax=Streptomyces glaucescens TaxID=1907 RepID=UPI001AD83A36|nr:MarR family winged helix-turn-helix transcriptional regulator [Streptomyces glaucescens]
MFELTAATTRPTPRSLPVSQAELGRGPGNDPKDMAAILNDLQNDGLVIRAPDAGDRRKNALSLSPSGERRPLQTEKLGRGANEELTAALTPAERTRLMALLARMVEQPEPCASTGPDGEQRAGLPSSQLAQGA